MFVVLHRNDDHVAVRAVLAKLPQGAFPVHYRHDKIKQNDIVSFVLTFFDAFSAVLGDIDGVASMIEHAGDEAAHGFLVVNNQNIHGLGRLA